MPWTSTGKLLEDRIEFCTSTKYICFTPACQSGEKPIQISKVGEGKKDELKKGEMQLDALKINQDM